MRAAVFHEVGKLLSIETVADPVPQADEVILEVSSCAICGSDLHMTQYPGYLAPGSILGHEFVGTVVETNGSDLPAGARATALPLFGCWNCDECRSGHFAHCASLQIAGVSGKPGGFARYVAVPAKMVRVLPPGIAFEEGSLIEPMAVGHHAVAQAGSLSGRSVLVIGAGQVGAAVAMFAAVAGAKHVVVSEPAAGRRERAMAIGAMGAIDPGQENVAARFSAMTGNRPDVVFECVGVPGMIATAIELVRNRGQVVVVGACVPQDNFMPLAALMKEVVLRFSSAYTMGDFDKVMDAFAHQRIKPSPMITARVGLDALPETFEALRAPSDQCLVVVDIA